MQHTTTRKRHTMESGEVTSRLAFFQLQDEDLALLASLRPFAEKHTDGIIKDFYELLMAHPGSRAYLLDPTTVGHLKVTQRAYFLRLFSGVLDEDYVENRLRVGAAHERIGMPPKWYLGAYAYYLRLIHGRMMTDLPAGVDVQRAYDALQKLVFFDATLAIDTYIEAHIDSVRRHQAAIRELSTPVIRLYDRVLLLPIVGTVDSHRAQQIMETALQRVVDEQAKVLLFDISGVSVVDTQVADNLIKTTAAVRLLGARTILTGISPQVARTIIELGVDISAMETRNKLADGIDLAFSIVGKRVLDAESTR